MRTLLENKIILLISTIVLILSFIITPFLAFADFNQQINYQGKLTDSSGVAVADGTYNMKFWLIASSTAATSTAVWAETRISGDKVQVTNGLFSVMLGEVTSLASVDFNQTLYLGVEIGGSGSPTWDGEMTPRKILGAVPAAFEAENAQTLAGIATTSFLRSDTIDTMEATSSSALLTLIQNGAGKLLSVFSGVTEMFTISNTGNVGIATTTPAEKLTVVGNTYLGGGLTLTGALKDSTTATGTLGMILKTTGTSTQWVATSTLGLGNGTFLGLTDTPSSFTANRLLFTNSGGTALTDSANLVFDGTNFGIGSTTPSSKLTVAGSSYISNQLLFDAANTESGVVFAGDNYLAHSSWKDMPESTGILLPMYIYPSSIYTNDDYNEVIDMKKRYHNVPLYVILNPSNGAGGVTDGNFTVAIQRLRGAGAIVLGYVASNYTASTTAEVKAEIDGWETYYPEVDGIFIDEMTNTASTTAQSYYTELTRYIHGKGFYPSIGNPGAGTVGEYFASSTADVIVVHETGSYPSETTLKGDYDEGYADFDYSKRAGLVYDSATLNTASTTLLKKYLGLIYVTDDTTPNPWDTVSPHLENLFEMLSVENKRYFTDLYVDGNLGIGTTTPLAKLDITGSNSTAVLGSELISATADRDFSSDTGKWTGTNWSIGSGVITHTAGANNLVLDNTALSSSVATGTIYQITFTTNTTVAGTVTPKIGGGWGTPFGQSTGSNTQTQVITANASTALTFTPSAAWTGTIDNVSVKVISTSSATQIVRNSDGSVGVELRSGGIGLYNTFLGLGAGRVNTTGSYNTANGNQSLYSNTTGSYNIANGYQSLYSNTTGSYNIANGYQSLFYNTTGVNNNANGYQSLYSNITGTRNTANGNESLYANTTGSYNTANGNESLYANTTGSYNTANGYQSLFYNTTGSENTANGSYSLNSNITGTRNTANGNDSLSYNTTGSYNTANGSYSLYYNEAGSQNIALGYNSGRYLTNGSSANASTSKSVFLGYDTRASIDGGINEVVIGAEAIGAGSNTVTLGSTTITKTILQGNVGIGSTTPSDKLTVVGNTYLGGGLTLTGALKDSTSATGTLGMVLQTTGTSTQWVATSTLGLGNGTFLGLTDTPSSFTANRLMFTNSGATALTDSANLTFDGTDFGVGAQNGIAFGGTRYLYASSTNDSISFGENAGATFSSSTIYNTAIGFGAGRYASTSDSVYNNFIGYQAGYNNTGSYENVFGYEAGYNNSGYGNNLFGVWAGYNNTGAYSNMFGEDAGRNNSSDQNNLFGYQAGYNNNGLSNNMFGYKAGRDNLGGDYNNIFGSESGHDNTGDDNNIFGRRAGLFNTGSNNNLTGFQAGISNTGSNNNLFGYSAGSSNTGSYNNLFGNSAGSSNTGSYNNLFGYSAGLKNKGSYNEMLGYESGYNLQSTSSIIIGTQAYRGGAGSTAFQAINNVALGYRAGYAAQTGASNNILLGYQAADNLTTGANNIVIGYDVDIASTTRSNQLNIGNLIFGTGIDGTGTTLSSGNIGIGTTTPSDKLTVIGNTYLNGSLTLIGALKDSTSATGTLGMVLQTTGTSTQWVATSSLGISGVSTFLALTDTPSSFTANRLMFTNSGATALTDSADLTFDGTNFGVGAQNGIAFGGTRYLYASSTNDSIAFGENAGATFNSSTNYNIALGYEAGRYASDLNADSNNYIGGYAGQNNTGSNNNLLGSFTGQSNTGDYNNILGYDAGNSNSGSYNSMSGYNAGYNNTGDRNNLFGDWAGRDNTGSYNNLIGYWAGYSNTGSYNNTFGHFAGRNNTGSYNNIFGQNAGYQNSGSYNEMIGYETGRNLQSTSSVIIGGQAYRGGAGSTAFQAVNNTALGYRAGYAAQTGASNNILLGYQAADNLTTGANNIVIGYDVDIASTTRSNQLNIGNLIFGTGIDGTGTTLSSGNIGIGSTTPSSKLTVAGSVDITNAATSSAAITLRDTIGGISLELRAGTSTLANTFVGLDAGKVNTTGSNNSALGKNTLKANTTGSQNTANGSSALAINSSGSDNTAIGSASLLFNSTGYHNTAVGSESLYYNQTGFANTAFGKSVGYGVLGQAFSSSTLMGYQAGYAITTGSRNNLFGYRAGDNITSGQGNIILGYDIDAPSATANNQLSIGNLIFGTSLDGTGTSLSSGNIGIGSTTPSSKLTVAGSVDITNTSTSSPAITLRDTIGGISLELRAGTSTLLNTFVGVDAGKTNTTGSQNTSNGYKALFSNTTGSDNSVYGFRALYNNTTGSNNTALGSSAGRYIANGATGNDTSSNSLYLGYNTKALADGGTNEIVIGYTAVGAGSNTVTLGSTTITSTILQGNVGIGTTTPNNLIQVYDLINFDNTASSTQLGYQAGKNLVTGATHNTFIGYQSGYSSSTGSTNDADYNTTVGYRSLFSNTTGYENTANGANTLYSNTTGTYNTANGSGAIYTNRTGTANTANGYTSLYSNIAGSYNTANGAYSLYYNTSSNNTANGYQSLFSNNTGFGNTANGSASLYSNTTGSYNTANGYNALTSNITGSYNTVLGYNSGRYLTNGSSANASTSKSIFLGYDTRASIDGGINEIVIGAQAIGAGSNTVTLGSTTITKTILQGNIGIGTTTPESLLAMEKLTFTGAGIAGINQYLKSTNVTASAVQYGNYGYLYASNTATTTIAGNMFKIEDNTTFGNTVRGFEVQTDRGINTLGENTALSGFARTFGVRGTTKGDAGGTYEPAGVFAETQGTTQGNAIRGYSASITTTSLLKLFQDTSTFVGTGLLMNFGNSGGSFSSTTASKFIDLQNAGTSMFTVGAYGALTIGDGTTNHNAGLAVGYGGICVDNDGSCNASTTGRVSAVSYHTGNSDLAETYFSSENLKTGDVVYIKGGLSVGKAGENNKDNVIGVVSTKPGLLLGSDDSSLKAGEKAYPIALKGRVPVRLSNENGEIKVGDELMLSSVEGVVMKATSTGKIVGVALEDFEGSRAYSDTYINQFGDDLVDPVFEPINHDSDPRINDGCYFGGGNASGDEVCVPLVSTTTDGQIAEAEALAKREAEERALAKLATVSAEKLTLSNGQEVNVGQIVMFVDLRHRYLDDNGMQMMSALLANASTTNATEVSETVWQRVVNLANNFVDGVLSVFTLKADKVEVKDQLCVDGVCVTGDDLRQLLNKNNNSDSGEVTNNPEPVTEKVIEKDVSEENKEATVTEENVVPPAPIQESSTPSTEPESQPQVLEPTPPESSTPEPESQNPEPSTPEPESQNPEPSTPEPESQVSEPITVETPTS